MSANVDVRGISGYYTKQNSLNGGTSCQFDLQNGMTRSNGDRPGKLLIDGTQSTNTSGVSKKVKDYCPCPSC